MGRRPPGRMARPLNTRQNAKPVTVVYKGIPHRFGHTATDRQSAYFSDDHIRHLASHNPLAHACAQAVLTKVFSWKELEEMYSDVEAKVRVAFEIAVKEPKISRREDAMQRARAPWVPTTLAPTIPPLHRPQHPLRQSKYCANT